MLSLHQGRPLNNMTISEKAKLQTKPDPEKYCAHCGQRMERRRNANGRLEDYGSFIRRKYCSLECMRKGFVKQGDEKQHWSSAHHSARKLAYDVIGKDKVCEVCGSTENLDVHHKDGNESNNVANNLMIVCRSCHNKLHRGGRICSVEGCNRPHKGLGYCNMHLIRYKQTGNPLLTKYDLRK